MLLVEHFRGQLSCPISGFLCCALVCKANLPRQHASMMDGATGGKSWEVMRGKNYWLSGGSLHHVTLFSIVPCILSSAARHDFLDDHWELFFIVITLNQELNSTCQMKNLSQYHSNTGVLSGGRLLTLDVLLVSRLDDDWNAEGGREPVGTLD